MHKTGYKEPKVKPGYTESWDWILTRLIWPLAWWKFGTLRKALERVPLLWHIAPHISRRPPPNPSQVLENMPLGFFLPRPTVSRVNSKDTLIPRIDWSYLSEIPRWDFPAAHQSNWEGLPLILPSHHSSLSCFSPPPPLSHTCALQRKSLSFTGNPASVLVDCCHRGEWAENCKASRWLPGSYKHTWFSESFFSKAALSSVVNNLMIFIDMWNLFTTS